MYASIGFKHGNHEGTVEIDGVRGFTDAERKGKAKIREAYGFRRVRLTEVFVKRKSKRYGEEASL